MRSGVATRWNSASRSSTTADYGPESSSAIAGASSGCPNDLVIATKAGFQRPVNKWVADGRPEHLRAACEGSLRRLKLERIDLFQLHRIDPKVALQDQIGALLDLQREGKIRHIGLSEVTVGQIEAVRGMTPVASVQNRYNLADRNPRRARLLQQKTSVSSLVSLATGDLAKWGGPLARVAAKLDARRAQVALAWLLRKSPVMLPIPGTSKVKHLEENTAAALLDLDDSIMGELERQPAADETE
jgi:aryl-alcohol dehydrogenase-like predicted oxidoreductase